MRRFVMLHKEASYPGTRSFVLKLHRDVLADGEFFGRLENIVSGRHFDFRTGQEMLAILASEVRLTEPPQRSSDETEKHGRCRSDHES
jgi:sortase (surface protein transpeptidase)